MLLERRKIVPDLPGDVLMDIIDDPDSRELKEQRPGKQFGVVKVRHPAAPGHCPEHAPAPDEHPVSSPVNSRAGVDDAIAVPGIDLVPQSVLHIQGHLTVEGAGLGHQFFDRIRESSGNGRRKMTIIEHAPGKFEYRGPKAAQRHRYDGSSGATRDASHRHPGRGRGSARSGLRVQRFPLVRIRIRLRIPSHPFPTRRCRRIHAPASARDPDQSSSNSGSALRSLRMAQTSRWLRRR